MADPKLWSNVSVAFESALAAADTITAITKANPGVVTSTAHGLTNGDYVKLTIQGMSQLDGRVARVANAAADTFELEGIDTTLFDTFSSGTAEGITYGTTIGTIRNLSASGGDPNFIDVTTIHDNVSKQIPGLSSAISYSLENIWDVSDTALLAMKTASDAQSQKAFKFMFADGQLMVFNGYISAPLLPTGSAQDLITSPATITLYGTPTYYAS